MLLGPYALIVDKLPWGWGWAAAAGGIGEPPVPYYIGLPLLVHMISITAEPNIAQSVQIILL